MDDRSTTAEQLSLAGALAEQGKYTRALEAIRQVKVIEPRNIYVLAFERQIEQLMEMTEKKILTDEHRADILESIPGIVERAMAGPEATPEQMAAGDPTALRRATDERAAALMWLKDQYFQHAHEYVSKEEYAHALAEIRRVFIIDPRNTTARDFERRIEELAALQAERLAMRRTSAGSTGSAAGMASTSGTAGTGTAPEGDGMLRGQYRWVIIALVVLALAALAWFLLTRST